MGTNEASRWWQGARVGAVSAKMALFFVLARRRRLDLVTVEPWPNGEHPSEAEWGKDAQPTKEICEFRIDHLLQTRLEWIDCIYGATEPYKG